MMHKQEVNFHIKRCLLTLNKNLDDTQKGLDDFMDKSLKWCSEMKSVLKNEIEKAKKMRKKKDFNVPQVIPGSNQRITRGASTFVNNINIAEAHLHIANESISCRTRGALKSLQSSILTSENMTCNETQTRQTRGRSRIRTTKAQNETVVIKRGAEETIGMDSISKKIKQEILSVVQDDVFKKPKPRGRKPKKTKESNSKGDTAIEESITFNAVLHSSPNGNTDENTFLVSPKNLSVIPKSPGTCQILEMNNSPKLEVDRPKASSNSNDFINDSQEETLKAGKKLTGEVDGGRDSSEEARITRTVTKNGKILRKKFEEIEKTTSSTTGDNGTGKNNCLATADSTISPNTAEMNGKSSDVKESERFEVTTEDKLNIGNNDAVDSTESNPPASVEKPCKSHVESGKMIREMRSVKEANVVELWRVKKEPVTPEGSSLLQDLNNTKVVQKATKRTKPVLKSRIFDSKGNILASGNFEKSSVKANSPQKPYTLRSSSSRENFGKKEPVSLGSTNMKKPVETRGSERRSNAENEPEVKRTKKIKRTKTKKTETSEVVDDGEGRVTRTKSKKAKQAMEEIAARKSGIIELARKSLHKAKLISLQKDQPKTNQILAARLTHQKRQISMSKANAGSREDLLGSSNKLSLFMSANTGSYVKPPRVQCLKSSESVLSIGKNKYLNLGYADPKDKYITPGKRCLSPDVLKSTSKKAREDEIEKELKLRALKEKEEEAQMKREMAIKMRQNELKEKNKMKLQSAMKQRKKLEQEKYNNKIQLEKEKEEKRKLLLREREMIMKEKARLKKELMEQKLAETEERRRIEEEARIAKLKEQEAEQERIMLEKQKELERHEKRAQERLAEQKARENYEMKLKTEQLLREKQQQLAAQSANKAAMRKGNHVKQWNYKPRNENDLGLDDEESELESENESTTSKSNRPLPKWVQGVKESRVKCLIKQEAMLEYMKCHQKTPDIHKMFKMTPNKRIKRTSSAIWNTPSS